MRIGSNLKSKSTVGFIKISDNKLNLFLFLVHLKMCFPMNLFLLVPPTMTKDDVIRAEVKEGENVNLMCPSSDSSDIEWRQVCIPTYCFEF